MEGQQFDPSVHAQAVQLQDGLRRLTLAIVEGLRQQLGPYQIDAVEYTILGVCLATGPTTIKDLQSMLPIDYTQISRTTSRLEDKGLMAKAHLADDRRIVRVEVTDRGRELMPELMQSALRFYKGLVGDISQEELAACTAVMQKLSASGEPAESGGAQ
ncbi:MAG: MarR family transcriptional regulator [Chloroflexi bacterium]|nr:MarR family transcriptional regulator [Chloroflexota bacterium]